MTVRDFVPCVPHPNQGLVIAGFGAEKVGKTHFGFTFPEPIFMFNFDFGWEAAIKKFEGKDIRRADFFVPERASEFEKQRILADFEDSYIAAFEQVGAGTVMVDTASQLDQIVIDVTLKEAAEDRHNQTRQRFDYQVRNRLMNAMLRRPYLYPEANVILLHTRKEVYDGDGKPTGRMVMACFGATPSAVQATIELTYTNKQANYRFVSCRHDRALEGLVVPDPSYESLKAMLS